VTGPGTTGLVSATRTPMLRKLAARCKPAGKVRIATGSGRQRHRRLPHLGPRRPDDGPEGGITRWHHPRATGR